MKHAKRKKIYIYIYIYIINESVVDDDNRKINFNNNENENKYFSCFSPLNEEEVSKLINKSLPMTCKLDSLSIILIKKFFLFLLKPITILINK